MMSKSLALDMSDYFYQIYALGNTTQMGYDRVVWAFIDAFQIMRI